MTDDEVSAFLTASRTATMATIGADGSPHLVAMWFALVDGGKVAFETKAKSQKVANLRRNPRITVMAEAGETYDQLRGVAIEGTAEILEDAGHLWDIGVSVFERYQGPFTEEMRPFVEAMLTKRVGVIVHPERVRSWDHRKLGLDPMPRAGSTADATP